MKYIKTKRIEHINLYFLVNLLNTSIKWGFVFMLIVLTSCNGPGSSKKDSDHDLQSFEIFKGKANQYQNLQLDSAILYADSAITMLRKMGNYNSDTLFTLIKIKATAFMNKGLFDSTVTMLDRIYAEAIDQKNSSLQIKTAILLGGFALDKDKLSIVEKYIPNVINMLDNQVDESDKAQAYNIYGAYLGVKGENNKAIEFSMKAYKIFEVKKMFSNLSFVSVNIGNDFLAIGGEKDALKYYRNAVDAATKSKDTANLMSTLCNIGVYYREENPDSAIFYYDKVIALKPVKNTPDFVVSAQYNKANIYLDKKDFKKALSGFNKVLAISQLTKNYTGMAYAYNGISSVYENLGKRNLSMDLLKRAVNMADSLGETALKMSLNVQLQTAYENNANYKEAYLLSKQIKVYNDSTKSVEKQIAIHDIEANYQSEKKELENKLLKSELIKKDNLLISRNFLIVFLIIASLIFAVLFWRVYVVAKQRSMAYDVLMKKYKQESEEVILLNTPALSESAKPPIHVNDLCLQLYDQVVDYYTINKPYLDPNFKVETIIADLNSSHKAILQALKLKSHSFNTLTNLYRVEEAKKRMADETYNNLKIEAIAKDSGFGTKMSFYNAFEQVTGVKPSFYRNNILQEAI